MRTEIQQALQARYPELKARIVERITKKYIDVMLGELAYSIAEHGTPNDEISLHITDIREKIGKVSINGKQLWVTDVMKTSKTTSLITINFIGNVGKFSRASINELYENKIMDELTSMSYELHDKNLNQSIAQTNVKITVELEYLESFLKKTMETYLAFEQDNSKHFYRKKLARNIMVANQLKSKIQMDTDGTCYVPEYWTQLDSGRDYGHGLSLQRIPKEVRHAALGVSHKYDFKASSFGLMASLAKELYPELKCQDVIDYVKCRTEIRRIIAKEIGISEDKAKQIFTSLGFGASTADNPYTSIRGKLGTEKYEALMANKIFRPIVRTMSRIRNVISVAFPDNFTFKNRTYSPIDPNNSSKKRTKNQKLAWLYQAMESDAILLFAEMAIDAGYKPILFAHDCVYFKEKLPADLLTDIRFALQKNYQYLQFEYEIITPISEDGFKPQFEIDRLKEIEEHKRFIKAETLAAGQITSIHELDQNQGYFKGELLALNERIHMPLGISAQIDAISDTLCAGFAKK